MSKLIWQGANTRGELERVVLTEHENLFVERQSGTHAMGESNWILMGEVTFPAVVQAIKDLSRMAGKF